MLAGLSCKRMDNQLSSVSSSRVFAGGRKRKERGKERGNSNQQK